MSEMIRGEFPYDPQDPKTLLAGGADAGIFISRDVGSTWTTVTDNSGTATRPVIPLRHPFHQKRERLAEANASPGGPLSMFEPDTTRSWDGMTRVVCPRVPLI